jgi:hypothetical protein
VCGVIALILVLFTLKMADYGGGYWWLLALISLVSFFCPWGAVRVLAWIIAGFISDVRNKPS